MHRPVTALNANRAEDEDRLLCFRTADPILASDERLRIVLWNAGAEALLGFGEREVLGRRCCEIIGCRTGACAPGCDGGDCTAPSGLDPLELVPTFDRELRRKDGARVSVNVTTILAATRGGQTVLVHLLRDLSRQKEIEELLQRVVSSAVKLSRLSAPTPERAAPHAVDLPCASVTAREREVIRLLAQGASTGSIAAKLVITERTARNHIQNILCKLGAHSRLEAVARASTSGLL